MGKIMIDKGFENKKATKIEEKCVFFYLDTNIFT